MLLTCEIITIIATMITGSACSCKLIKGSSHVCLQSLQIQSEC